MIIRKPQVFVPESQFGPNLLQKIERYARVCYKSEDRIGTTETEKFLASILSRGHESIIEHEKLTVLFIVDRGVSHEIVRHRIASYSQESTRYCNYGNEKFGREISVIEPYFFVGKPQYQDWVQGCSAAENAYMKLLESGSSPQEARSVLPNSLKTEIVVSYNLREWRHFFNLRCSTTAHPQMRQVTIPLLQLFISKLPVLYSNIEYDSSFPVEHFGRVILTDDFFNPLTLNT